MTAPTPMATRCHVCGAAGASHGLRFPGCWSDIPKHRRGYLRHCPTPECTAAAEGRLARALLAEGRDLPRHLERFASAQAAAPERPAARPAPPAPPRRSPPANPAQGSLL